MTTEDTLLREIRSFLTRHYNLLTYVKTYVNQELRQQEEDFQLHGLSNSKSDIDTATKSINRSGSQLRSVLGLLKNFKLVNPDSALNVAKGAYREIEQLKEKNSKETVFDEKTTEKWNDQLNFQFELGASFDGPIYSDVKLKQEQFERLQKGYRANVERFSEEMSLHFDLSAQVKTAKKLLLNLSVPQTAYLFGLLERQEVVTNMSSRDVFQFIHENISTVNTESPQPGSLKNHYTKPKDKITIEKVKDLLMDLHNLAYDELKAFDKK